VPNRLSSHDTPMEQVVGIDASYTSSFATNVPKDNPFLLGKFKQEKNLSRGGILKEDENFLIFF
jgi:hypothetical protein